MVAPAPARPRLLLGPAPALPDNRGRGRGRAANAAGHCGLVAKLSDFGISRVAPELSVTKAQSYVRTCQVAGTPAYMPMEYHSSGRVSAKVDAYAYGVVLMELLTGRQPFDATTREPLVEEFYARMQQVGATRALARSLADPLAGEWDSRRWLSTRFRFWFFRERVQRCGAVVPLSYGRSRSASARARLREVLP